MLPKGSRVRKFSQKTLTKGKQNYKTVPRALRAYTGASNDTVTPQPTLNGGVLLEFLRAGDEGRNETVTEVCS